MLEPATPEEAQSVLIACAASPRYFIEHFGWLYDNKTQRWLRFTLWPAQREALELIHAEQLVVALKARQLGMTWLCLAYILWQMIFRSIAKPLVFSRTEEDAMYLLGNERLRGMHRQLPEWLVHAMNAAAVNDASKTWTLANGSVAHAFPPNRGDSYTATFALADEFDVLDEKEQNQLMRSVKPTIDYGGKMVLLSRADKSRPESQFKKTYREARAGRVPWKPLFLPWNAHPGRTKEWYEQEKASVLSTTGSLDDIHEQYPASAEEALAPRSLDKRLPAQWLLNCYVEMQPLDELPADAPALPDLDVYRLPEPDKRYVISGDPAEGNVQSDDSASVVLNRDTGEEVACLAGKFDPTVFAGYIDQLGTWYNRAAVMVERSNHGHAVLMWLHEHSELEILWGHDGKPGWLSSQKGKALLYTACADAFRNGETTLHSFATFTQLASIEGSTLRAPEKQHDDRADAYALALAAPPPSIYEERGLRVI